MGQVTLFSNRIYKKDVDNKVNVVIDKTIKEYSSVKFAASAENLRRLRNKEITPPNTLYYNIESKFPDVSIYLKNSAVQKAKAAQKSTDAHVKLRIDNTEQRLKNINQKITRTKCSKADLQSIKDNLKAGSDTPFKKGSRKFKIGEDGSVTVTAGKGKTKRTAEYKCLYDFECRYLRPKQKLLKSRLGLLVL